MRHPAIDPEFEALIPPLSVEEIAALGESLTMHGCRDPLVVWKETGILLDGHHRLRLCREQRLPYQIVELSFPSREVAADWMDANQLARRNLNADAMSLLRGRRFNRLKRQGIRTDLTSAQNEPKLTSAHFEPKLRTRDQVAGRYGISGATVQRDGEFAAAVEALTARVPDIVHRVVSGQVPSRAAVIQAAANPRSARRLLSGKALPHVARSTGNYEWHTPNSIIDLARAVMAGIDLDPASTEVANRTVRAKVFYSIEDNGLVQPWYGRVWLNPPYGRGLIEPFAARLVEMFRSGAVKHACVLVNNATETEWFHALLDTARALCFLRGRVAYQTPDGDGEDEAKGLQGQVSFYLGTGAVAGRYAEKFGTLGKVVQL